MRIARLFPCRATMRDMAFMSTPSSWPIYPFLPLVRRSAVGDCQQLGVLYDAVGDADLYGYSATVFLTNLFTLPQTQADFLALPKYVYDTLDELVHDGWVVD